MSLAPSQFSGGGVGETAFSGFSPGWELESTSPIQEGADFEVEQPVASTNSNHTFNRRKEGRLMGQASDPTNQTDRI